MPSGARPKAARATDRPRVTCSRASCGYENRGGSAAVGIARRADSVSITSGRMGWYSGEQVISTWPRSASARQRGAMPAAIRRCASTAAIFSSSV